jgi:Protein of unknown function (DUF664)
VQFSDALPRHLAVATLATRLADLDHAATVLGEQASISRQIAAERDLDTPCAWPPFAHRNLRWVLLHMIEETARHAGHADIIRETLGGSRGY